MINKIDAHLETLLDIHSNTCTKEAMRYSLMSGGKRMRPRLLLALLQDFGVDVEEGLTAACALEYIHTYSLIHDDLPAMDNDDVRRFKPTNHIVYGEGQAILAGDALLNDAPYVIAQEKQLSAEQRIHCIEILMRNAGASGMILGQELDVDDNIETLDHLIQCYEKKTGCLFAAALGMASIIAKQNHLQEKAEEIGILLGVAFQFQDDLLEVLKSSEEIGKSSNSDLAREKTTIVSLLGVEEAKALTDAKFKKLSDAVASLGIQTSHLNILIEEITKRPL